MILPEYRWSRAKDVWSDIEHLGYDHAWTYDHLMWRWLSDKEWYATVPTLAAAAAATSRITIGTLVATPNFRHPVNFAKELMTLDDISGGRLMCGLGAGAVGYDTRLRGDSPVTKAQRGARFREFVTLLDELLREPRTSFEGRFYTAEDVYLVPGCVQKPRIPFCLAATGPAGISLAAEYADVWVTTGIPNSFELEPYADALWGIKRQMSEVDKACSGIGRDPASLRRLLVTDVSVGGVLESVETYRDAVGRFEEIGFTDFVVHRPREEFPFKGSFDVIEEFGATELSRV
ncbi:LLM class flavin-dependent oxidoreductase [Nocardia rhamnosiphila]|uniref:LLM class flavin-dependent oxidoreductase n=1 Tax=Nocardia rhamnosiphila TaxID=426716 RepID=UPI0033F01715